MIILNLKINDENMSFVYVLSKLLKIKKRSFIKSMNLFLDYHTDMKFSLKKKYTFINDSKSNNFTSY